MKKRTRVLSLIMTVAIVLSSLVIVVPVSAEPVKEIKDIVVESDGRDWTDFVSETGFAGGAGTADDPYQIATAEQLALFAAWSNEHSNYSIVQAAYFVLTDDIDLAGHEWVSIGSWGNVDMRFKGYFDGQGHTIKNMTITNVREINASNIRNGLFGYVGGGTTIQNFTLTGSITIDKITSNSNESAIGMVASKVSGFVVLDNIDVYTNMNITIQVSEPCVGGLVGAAHNADIRNCSVNGSITVTGAAHIPLAGGIAGWASGALYATNTVNNADITLYSNNTNCIGGGIVGKCGLISSADTSDNTKVTEAQIIKYGTIITNCVNNGDIRVNVGASGGNQRIGGIAGNVGRGSGKIYVYTTIENCINTGKISISNVDYFGSSSGISSIAGFIEINATDYGTQVVPTKYTIKNCFSTFFNDPADNVVLAQYYASGNAPVNGAVGSRMETPADSDRRFAVETITNVDNTVTARMSRQSLELFLEAGYEMKLMYGDMVITSIDNLIKEYNSYAAVFPMIPGEKATLVVTKTFLAGTDAEDVSTIVAADATWADFYAKELAADPTIDAELYAPGTEQNPYLISSAGELAMLALMTIRFDTLSNVHCALVADIDLSAHEWLPIGSAETNKAYNRSYKSSAIIHGYGHTISGIRLTSDRYSGAQAFLASSAWTIENVKFSNITIGQTSAPVHGAAGLIGTMNGGALKNVSVENVTINSTIADGASVAGVIARWENGTFENVTAVNVNINATATGTIYAGGFAGYSVASALDGVSASGSLLVNATKLSSNDDIEIAVGGMLGTTMRGTIDNSNANVNVLVNVDSGDDAATDVGVGGLVGIQKPASSSDTLKVNTSANSGAITLNYSNGGNFVGAGGFVGISSSKTGKLDVADSVNAGVVQLNKIDGKASSVAMSGSFLGYYNSTSRNSAKFTSCVSMVGDSYTGGAAKTNVISTSKCIAADLGLASNDKAVLFTDKNYTGVGMTFTSSYDVSGYNKLVSNKHTVTFGTLIVPAKLLESVGGNAHALACGYVAADFVGEIVNGTYSGSIANIKSEFQGQDLVAVPYYKMVVDGVEHTFYGAYDYAYARSAADVAEEALADVYHFYDEELGYVYYVEALNKFSFYTTRQQEWLKALAALDDEFEN